MPNEYYNRVTDFIPDTAVRSSDLDQELDAVVRGFDLLSDPDRLGVGAQINGTDTGNSGGYVIDNGGSDQLIEGQIVTFTPSNTNTGASTATVNGSDNVPIVRNDGTPLQPGDLIEGVPVMMIYDSVNNRWVLVGATAQQVAEQLRPGISVTGSVDYTLSISDENDIVSFTAGDAISVTIPSASDDTLPDGFITHVHQDGAGQITLVPGAGVTLRTAASLSTRAQFSSLSIIKIADDVFKIIGDMAV